MSSILRVENLCYKDILDNVSFEIEKNSFNVVVGPNSCGKTTLVKCLSGLLEYTGYVLFNNCLISSKESDISVRKEIGVVIDILPVLDGNSIETVMSYLMFPLLNLGYSEIDAKKRIYSVLDKLNIGFMLVKKLKELKYCEKKILCFIRGIIHNPKLVIVDDIFDSLSVLEKEKIFNYLKKMNNTTVVFMTNNEEYILYANNDKDNVLVMNKGKIIKQSLLGNVIKDEKIFIKNGLKLPYVVELSHKLKAYGLLNDITIEIDEMVNEIWQ